MRKVSIMLTFIFISCNNSNHIPPGIIKPVEMQNVLWDMIRGDILAQEMLVKDSTRNIKSTGFAITENIFAIHNIDRVKFEKSITFYEKHPVLLRTIFDSLNAIETRKNSLESEKRAKPVKDYHLLRGNKIP